MKYYLVEEPVLKEAKFYCATRDQDGDPHYFFLLKDALAYINGKYLDKEDGMWQNDIGWVTEVIPV